MAKRPHLESLILQCPGELKNFRYAKIRPRRFHVDHTHSRIVHSQAELAPVVIDPPLARVDRHFNFHRLKSFPSWRENKLDSLGSAIEHNRLLGQRRAFLQQAKLGPEPGKARRGQAGAHTNPPLIQINRLCVHASNSQIRFLISGTDTESKNRHFIETELLGYLRPANRTVFGTIRRGGALP